MKRLSGQRLVIGLSGVVLLNVLAYAFLEELVAKTYDSQAPTWFEHMVGQIYPRFEVEKNRFDLDFFVIKAHQVLWRFDLWAVIILSYWWALGQFSKLHDYTTELATTSTTRSNLVAIRGAFFLGIIFYSWAWIYDLEGYRPMVSFYQPIFIYKVFGIPFPSQFSIKVVYGFILVPAVLTIVGYRPYLFSIVTVTAFVFAQGFFYCFEKYDHRFVTLTYSLMLMPFLIRETKQHDLIQSSWPLQWIRIVIGSTYLLAGLEKLFTSGGDWLAPETLRGYLFLHQSNFGLWISEFPIILILISTLVLAFQLGFLLIIIFPKRKLWFLSAGIGFHFGTVLLLDVGDFLTPWIFVYLFFVDWSWLVIHLERFKFSHTPLKQRVV